jgi:hypothetical protein
MAGEPLHHQPSLVLMAGRPLHHQPSLVLIDGAASSPPAGTGRRIPVQDLASSAVPGRRISVLDTASSTVSGPGRRISVRSSFFSSTRTMHTRPSGVGCPPGPWTATGRRTVFQTLTPQPGTVFPGTPARFLHTQAGLAGVEVWAGALWRPTY